MMILIIAVLLFGLYLLSLRGRKNHPGLTELRKWSYAHRGLHDSQRPENSMSAFRAALEAGYGIELDVHLLKDGGLAVMHDSCLKRMTGADVQIEDLTLAELENYRLRGTEESIPIFGQVLELFDGKAPLIVELKTAGHNAAALTEAVCRMLDEYHGAYCLESFDPRCLICLKKNRPEWIRGQLTENYFRSNSSLPWILKVILTNQLENFLTMPDFVAYRFSDRKNFGNDLVRKLWGVQGVAWTLQSPQEHEAACAEGFIPIFENYTP